MSASEGFAVSSEILIGGLKFLKNHRKINYERIKNPIELKRLQNASVQIDFYLDSLKELNGAIKKIESQNNPLIQKEEKIAEMLLDELKMEFEIIAIIIALAKNNPLFSGQTRKNISDILNNSLNKLTENFEKLNQPPEIINNLFKRTLKEVRENLNSIY